MNIWLELVPAVIARVGLVAPLVHALGGLHSTGRNANRGSPHLTLLIADQYLLRSSLFRLCFVVACQRSLLRVAWIHLPHDETMEDRRSLRNPKPRESDK